MKSNKIIFCLMIILTLVLLVSCGKKKGARIIYEDGIAQTGGSIEFGVQKKGSASNVEEAVKLVTIYVPLGEGKFRKELFEVDEITPKTVFDGLVHFGVLDEESIFQSYREYKDENIAPQLAGPGAKEGKELLEMTGDLYIENLTAGYLVGPDGKDIATSVEDGFGGLSAYLDAVVNTYVDNFGLVDCAINPA
ncbi:MAG: hypothetical protein Q4F88_01245 [Eubacteriales bacterium]|nr:hypothetical protein [Eubacteriales bacterium]